MTLTSSPAGAALHFAHGAVLPARTVVAADGVHSRVRARLFPDARVAVLPLVALNGKRRVSRAVYAAAYAPHMARSTVLAMTVRDARLGISLDSRPAGSDADADADADVSISWTYSRPPRGADDALHRPDRSNAAARDIPEAFFREVGALGDLPPPFAHVFSADKVRGDRVLHWLMRRSLVPLEELKSVWKQSRVVVLGDAAHAVPILGGDGANSAILDALRGAEVLARMVEGEGGEGVERMYEERYAEWERGWRDGEERMREMHDVGVREPRM
ncbi:hypothetical protein ACN47E_007389 [Coniothyrium glycines]